MTEAQDELRRTSEKLRDLDERRKGLVEYRDRQVAEEIERKTTWETLQKLTGLSPRGLALSIERGRSRQ
jgi:signal transduction histidine kinase